MSSTRNEKTITNYLNEDYNQAAIYLTYRSTPSCIDGLKNSGRKIVYTAKKKNIKDDIKVSSFGGLITSESLYLHGDSSIQGAVVTAAQDYTGSNNLPYLKGEGSFGTRFMPQAAAARYIFTKPQPYFNALFKKEDECNLITQMFEGDEIEPRFYVPTIPLVLVNGCTGIGVGFATKILNRSTKDMIKALRAKLENKRVLKSYFNPNWNGFTGSVTRLADDKWEIRGVASLNKKKLLIEELPITYDLMSYIDVLKKLKDKGTIDKFDDLSDSTIDRFKFEVVLSEDESKKSLDEIMNDLKLSITITESLTCLDENNAITEFKNVEEIFDKYYQIKLIYLQKRITSEINRLDGENRDLLEVCKFIKEVLRNTINLKDKKDSLESNMKEKGYIHIDKLLSMPLNSLTEEKVDELMKRQTAKAAELEAMKKETPTSIWLKDLDELERLI